MCLLCLSGLLRPLEHGDSNYVRNGGVSKALRMKAKTLIYVSVGCLADELNGPKFSSYLRKHDVRIAQSCIVGFRPAILHYIRAIEMTR